jgi:hypothetical protein
LWAGTDSGEHRGVQKRPGHILPSVFLDRPLAKNVPELTIYFWVIKVLTTGMGEATSDYFVHTSIGRPSSRRSH